MPRSSARSQAEPHHAPPEDGSGDRRLEAVDAVLFDLDGTLIDTLELILASMRYATEEVLGAALPDEVMMHNVGIPLIEQMREFDEARAEELLATYREHNARYHDELVKEYPGVEESLRALQAAGYRLGIVTSKIQGMARRGLGCFGLEDYFSVVVGYDDVEIHKPDPHPLFVAAERIGVDIERCAYVGDSPHDVAAALAAGCVAVGALWGVAGSERILEAGPDYVVDSMEDVAGLFAGGRREGLGPKKC